MGGQAENNLITVNGAPQSNITARSLSVSPGWLAMMKIPLVAGRNFRSSDASPEAAIVNKQFAGQFFGGANPVGKYFEMLGAHGKQNPYEIVGLVEDAAYKDVRDAMLPVMYVPSHYVDPTGVLQPERGRMFVVRTSRVDPMVMGQTLRQEVQRTQPEFRVSNVTTQTELVRAQTIRERLLAMLATFFGAVALLLAAIGLVWGAELFRAAAGAGVWDSDRCWCTDRKYCTTGDFAGICDGADWSRGWRCAWYGFGSVCGYAVVWGEGGTTLRCSRCRRWCF